MRFDLAHQIGEPVGRQLASGLSQPLQIVLGQWMQVGVGHAVAPSPISESTLSRNWAQLPVNARNAASPSPVSW
jgi:hypothetical protein